MRTTTWVVAAGSVIICTDALAAPAKLPATVATDLKSVAEECSSVGGKPKTDDAIKRVDRNGDGKDDYVLDVGSIQCEGAASAYGDRAKMVSVYVGDGAGGAKQAFSEWVYSAAIVWNAKAQKFEFAPVSTVRMIE